MLIRMLKTNRMILVGMLILLVFAVGCSKQTAPVQQEAAPEAPAAAAPVLVSDDELSYRNEPLMDPSDTPVPSFEAPDPGDADLMERAFENSPPLIPHTTDGYLPITINDNQCLECHLPENAVDAEATATPASHLYDIRRDVQLKDLNPANFNCTQCHATQAEVAPLVANTFEPYFRTDDGASQSNLLDILNDGVE